MGAYLSEPVTDKCSTEEDLEFLSYGASAMQGWRTTQEDSHNCIPNLDTGTSLFAVYDGHGGAEVAQYCSLHLPDHIKSVESYKQGNLAQGLEDAFLSFDETLIKKSVISELKQLAGSYDKHSDEADENEVDHLYAEAQMPLEEVLAKYNSAISNSQISRLKGPKTTLSPFLKSKDKSSSKLQTDENEGSSKKDSDSEDSKSVDAPQQPDLSNGEVEEEEKIHKGQGDCSTTESRTSAVNLENVDLTESSETATSEQDSSVVSSASTDESLPGCSSDQPGGSVVRSCKYKAPSGGGSVDDESSSSDDETYLEVPYADTESDDEEEGEENAAGDEEMADEDEEEEDDDDEEEDEEEEEEENEREEVDIELENEPGYESGCTAVVAMIRGCELYVANAGDSRCVVCRDGRAIDMSADHKPEEEVEMKRINNAGGKVTSDGRVNGGLNLSRAIGDHTYKQNAALSLREQMITSLPDIRTLTLDPEEDEFMVLACDGIWNYMKSQEVIDFVKERIDRIRLSSICEELFDLCLAPNTHGDGTGCDNMTAIIVRFHPKLSQRKFEIGNGTAKRRLENGAISEQSSSKRLRESVENKDN